MSTDGTLLAGSGEDQDRIRLWHLPTGEPAGAFECGLPGAARLGFSPSGALVVATGGGKSRLLLWRPEPVLAGHTPVGDLTQADVQRVRRHLSGGDSRDLAWLDLLDGLVSGRG